MRTMSGLRRPPAGRRARRPALAFPNEEEKAMSMKITFPGGLRVNAAFKGFTVATDQPVEHGGGGICPTTWYVR
jgi:hypothetical protein